MLLVYGDNDVKMLHPYGFDRTPRLLDSRMPEQRARLLGDSSKADLE